MRNRLVFAFVGLAAVTVLLFGVPRAYLVTNLIEDEEQSQIDRTAAAVASVVAERQKAGAPLSEEFLAGLVEEGERLKYVAADGTVAATDRTAEVMPSDISSTSSLPDGSTLTLTRSGLLVDKQVSDAMLLLVVFALGLLLLAGAAGVVLARRLARPFGQLASLAGELGQGRFDVQFPTYDVPEADRISRALRESAYQLDGLVRREREFASNASHQLRTPLTALRLELEDLTMWPETPDNVRRELGVSLRELDRLSGVVNDLLALARARRLEAVQETDLVEIAKAAQARWMTSASAAGRKLTLPEASPVQSRVPPGAVAQILDVLVDNSIKHGHGDIHLAVDAFDNHLRIRVGDDGPGISSEAGNIFAPHVSRRDSGGEGIGLSVASDLAHALGGQLTIAPTRTTAFDLKLPALE